MDGGDQEVPPGRRNLAPFRARLIADAPTLAITLVLFLLCLSLMASKGVYMAPSLFGMNAQLCLASAAVGLLLDMGWRLYKFRPASPTAFLKDHYLRPEFRNRVLAGVPMLLVFLVFMPFFSKMKSMIPLFNDYTWDPLFIAWDQALFFGRDGWEVLQPLFGYPAITALLAALYHLWFLLLYPGCLFFCFFRIDELTRRRFFLSFVLTWTVIGGAMATAFASVGPCFLEPLLGNPHFADQMAYLNAANGQFPVMTLKVQQMLVDWFHADARGLGSGITAMPSMHVSMAFLYFLAVRHLSKRAASFFLAFCVLIFIGSVHLAYHYAVDGIVSIAATAAIWWATRHVFAWWDRQRGEASRPATQPAVA